MFYSQFILAKKGPLGTIWIAAHLERKLRKNQVADTDIGVSVDSILCPDVPIALRLSSHLLLGVVRIYSRKVSYLFDDCSDALLKVKQAFRSAAVDLPPEQSKAPYHSITLPETFDLDDFELPDNELFKGNFVDHHVSAREHITLQDSMDGTAFPTSQFGSDERFGDGDASQIGLDLDEELFLEKVEAAGTSEMLIDTDDHLHSSSKASPPPRDDEKNKGASDPPAASPVSYFSIQAPSTPGLMEESNFPGTEEAFVSDDHMDEEHNVSEFAAKHMSGTASSKLEPPNFSIVEFHADRNSHNLNEQKTEEVRSPGVDRLNNSYDHVEVVNGQENIENTLNGTCIIIEKNAAAYSEQKIHCEVDKVVINGNATPLTEETSVMDVHSSDQCDGSDKTDLNTTRVLFSDKSSASCEVPGTGEADADPQNADQICADVEIPEASECDTDVRLSNPSVPVLQACNSENVKIAEKVDNIIAQENTSEKEPESQVSDFSAPEKLLSMPNLPVGEFNDFLNECTPGKEDLAEGDGDATMETIISGRKRSYTESTLTIQSLSSAESSGATQSKRSGELIPNDDDLLSSILGGKNSIALKLKPTPPVVTHPVPSKRQKTAARSSAHKRKVLVDDSTVLHGDMIRQQLTDTEDIRRVRKKAPCTRREIWMLHKQFLEDEIFCETVFTGVSSNLVSLHSGTFVISRTIVIQDEQSKITKEMDTDTRPTLDVETLGQQGSTVAVYGDTVHEETNTVENDVVKEVSENHTPDNKDEKEVHFNTVDDTIIDSLSCGAKTGDQEGVNLPASEKLYDERLDEKYSAEGTDVETTVIEEDTRDRCPSSVRDISDTQSMLFADEICPTLDQFMVENQSNESGIAKLEETISHINHVYEKSELDSSSHNIIPNKGENQEYYETDPPNFPESTLNCTDYADGQGHAEEFETDVFEHDTGFLNVDDDDVVEDYEGDDMPSTDEKRVLDNSGWSSRTRAVANYLQVVFKKEALHGKKEVSLENLLTGKSRKEASRMFFETLVLKTKDYIHAEQGNSLCDIRIKPRGKLLKSEF